MALSNWDTYCVTNSEGEHGSLRGKDGTSIDIYKNWLYVRNKSMHTEGGSYIFPTIAQINSGVVTIGSVSIVAERGPKHGVYVCAWETIRTELEDSKDIYEDRCMAGIGCYGYTDGGDFVGVQETEVAHLNAMIKRLVGDFDIPDSFLGLLDSSGQRVNQGDEFFTNAFGIETPKTNPGDQEKPMIHDAIDGLKP